MANYVLKEGEDKPDIEEQFKDSEGEEIDLTNATVTFSMRDEFGNSKISGASVSIEKAKKGKVKYEWGSSDTDSAGFYRGNFKVVYNNGDTEFFPKSDVLNIVVLEDVS